MKKKLYILVFTLFLMTICISSVFAAEVTLAWNPSTGNPDGYKIHYGSSPGSYTQTVDVGNVTEYTIYGLQSYVIYYFAVSAYGEYGESNYSKEIQWPNPAPKKPVGLRIIN